MKQTITLSEEEIKEAVKQFIEGRDPDAKTGKAWTIEICVNSHEEGPQREPYAVDVVTAQASREV